MSYVELSMAMVVVSYLKEGDFRKATSELVLKIAVDMLRIEWPYSMLGKKEIRAYNELGQLGSYIRNSQQKLNQVVYY